MLVNIALFLAAAVVFVPFFKRLGLGAVLGYLCAGVAIGPWGLALISDVESILHVAEFGVVLLLFVIGLELQPSRLWHLRASVFGTGGLQVVLTSALLYVLLSRCGFAPLSALVAAFGLAMSSTAFVLQMLSERHELTTHHGRAAFSILLFQDLSVIPFLALVPMLGRQGQVTGDAAAIWLGVGKAVAAVLVTVIGGRYLLRPVLRWLAKSGVSEVFTAAALLVVVATALGMEWVGLSASLGAFLAGVLLADSEYRHELQADIEPFKGLLLGLFFIAVGMSANVGRVIEEPLAVFALVFGLIVVKALVLYAIGRFQGLADGPARSLALALAQGGEFAFVLFGVAGDAGLLESALRERLIVAVTLSMMLSPLLYALYERLRARPAPAPYDLIDVAATQVIIAGFGPFGQIIGRILRVKHYTYTVLDKSPDNVAFLRQLDIPVFYSDAARPEVLRAAHAGQARLFVVAIAEPAESLRVVEAVRRQYPDLPILACARTRQHALDLMDRGVRHVIRRSYLSSLEASRHVLLALGESDERARRYIDAFREHDNQVLLRQQAGPRDELALLRNAREGARELEELFDADTDHR